MLLKSPPRSFVSGFETGEELKAERLCDDLAHKIKSFSRSLRNSQPLSLALHR